MSNSALYLVCNKLHTFLILPAPLLIQRLPQLEPYLSNHEFAKVAWGDYQYYGASKQPWWLAAKALLTPTASVLSLQSLETAENGINKGETAYPMAINPSFLDAVAQFICSCFRITAEGQLTLVRHNPCGTHFFQSKGTYILCNTCNHWTSYALREAGISIKPMFNITSAQVQRSMVKNGFLASTKALT